MQDGADSETVWVTLPAQLEKRLGKAARALHCTMSEAALLAVRTKLRHLDKILRPRDCLEGTPAPHPDLPLDPNP